MKRNIFDSVHLMLKSKWNSAIKHSNFTQKKTILIAWSRFQRQQSFKKSRDFSIANGLTKLAKLFTFNLEKNWEKLLESSRCNFLDHLTLNHLETLKSLSVAKAELCKVNSWTVKNTPPKRTPSDCLVLQMIISSWRKVAAAKKELLYKIQAVGNLQKQHKIYLRQLAFKALQSQIVKMKPVIHDKP